MYFLGLAADYDGTIAQHGAVRAETCDALRKLKATGRRLILVTGRELAALQHAFPELAVFDRVVAENGGVLYDPATREERMLAPAAPAAFVERLMAHKVEPISVGRCVVATWEPHQTAVLDAIHELGLELQITFNKGAVMVLPAGVNKATGLQAALADIDISPHNVVGVGDAENDHAFLRTCGCAAAVANALPTVREEADVRLAGDHGAGVIELIHMIIGHDARMVPRSRHAILVGIDRAGREIRLEPERTVLIAGRSGSGKSRFATLLTERMVEGRFEFCVLDAEEDYRGLAHAVCLGDGSTPPVVDEVLQVLHEPGVNLVVNTLALTLPERERLLGELLHPISALRARTGRPHWLLVDEAHHVLAPKGRAIPHGLPEAFPATIFLTVDPESLAVEVLRRVELVIAFGGDASDVIARFAAALNLPAPGQAPAPAEDEALCWTPGSPRAPCPVKVEKPRQRLRRHMGKYAVGDVGESRSFHFRAPEGATGRRAQNLTQFLQIADEVDDAVWTHHLRANDYSAWFRDVIKDEELAQEAALIENESRLDPRESRRLIRKAVSRRYLAPVGGGSAT